MLSLWAALILSIAFYIGQGLFTPLAKIPGPWYTQFTSLWIKYQEFTANRRVSVNLLHRRYGPVVRLGPNEISFTSLDAIKEIYASGGSGHDKTEFYSLFKQFKIKTMFSTLSRDEVIWIFWESNRWQILTSHSTVEESVFLLSAMPWLMSWRRNPWLPFMNEQWLLWRNVPRRDKKAWTFTLVHLLSWSYGSVLTFQGIASLLCGRLRNSLYVQPWRAQIPQHKERLWNHAGADITPKPPK